MSVFRKQIPLSYCGDGHGRLEYCLAWLSTDGGVRQWFFASSKNTKKTVYKSVKIESLDDVRSYPLAKTETVDIFADSLTHQEMVYVSSVLESDRVFALGDDFTKTPVSINSGETIEVDKPKEFGVKVTLSFRGGDVLNV